MFIGHNVKYPFVYQVFMELEVSRQIFERFSNTKLHENPSNGSRVASCGRADGQDMTKPIVAFRNFAKSA